MILAMHNIIIHIILQQDQRLWLGRRHVHRGTLLRAFWKILSRTNFVETEIKVIKAIPCRFVISLCVHFLARYIYIYIVYTTNDDNSDDSMTTNGIFV